MDNNPYVTGLLKVSDRNMQVDAIYSTQCSVCGLIVVVLIYYTIGSLWAEAVLHAFLISPRAYYRVGT